ncbi:MAG: FliI/YscN family ATPase [Pseudomonadota bacterium]|jgi:flagellum-specific ATP synthase
MLTSEATIPASLTITGTIVSVQGTSITAKLPQASVGDLCWVKTRDNNTICGQIVSFQNELFSLALFEEPEGIYPGATVKTRGQQLSVPVGDFLLGRVINPLGVPLDGEIWREPSQQRSIWAKPPPASGRPPIDTAICTGVKAIDGFCTLGKGQRMGIFASAGVGKSTLLAMIARQASVDVIVVALVGERGREVQEFLDETLGSEGLRRSVIVVATSDDSSLLRQTAPYTATSIAEHFRDQGKDVLLIVDSLTRMARAVRETSIAAGDLPVRHGYTNSVYTQLPKLVERAGRSSRGSITALYTVLTNQEDDIDPLADEVKSLLDGHICLRKEIAEMGILPAIDITQSISRLFGRLHQDAYCTAARHITHALSRYLKDRQIILLGGVPDPELQTIMNHQQAIFDAVRQSTHSAFAAEETQNSIQKLSAVLKAAR